MNKKLLAVAIGAALAAPMYAQAAVTVGGQAHVSADYVDTLDAVSAVHNTKQWNVSSNVSNIFIKSDEDLGGGMKAIFFLQEYFRLDNNGGASQTSGTGTTTSPSVNYGTRMHDAPAYVGLSGNFGTILLGNQDTLTKLANRSVDLFNNAIGDTRNLGMDNTRFQNSVSYTSPTMGGVSLAWQHSTNADNGIVTPTTSTPNGFATPTINTTQLSGDVFAVKFERGPVTVNGAYMRLDDALSAAPANYYYTNQVTDLSASVKAGPARIVAAYQKNNNAAHTLGVQTAIWSLGTALTFGSETVKAQFSSLNAQSATSVGLNSTIWSIGYDHAFSKTFTGYAAFAVADNNSGARVGMTGGGGHGDTEVLTTNVSQGGPQQNGASLGVIYSF